MYLDGDTQTFSRVVPGENQRARTKEIASHYASEDRKARARNKRDPNQVKIEELEGEHRDLPF